MGSFKTQRPQVSQNMPSNNIGYGSLKVEGNSFTKSIQPTKAQPVFTRSEAPDEDQMKKKLAELELENRQLKSQAS